MLAGLAFSLAMTLAFEPFSLWPMALLAVVPLALVAMHPKIGRARPFRTAFFAWIGMLPFWGFVGHWVINISNIGYLPLVWYTALTTAIGVWLIAAGSRLMPRLPAAVLTPVLWTGAEVLRGAVVWDGYPWFQIGHPLIDAPALASPARLLGAYFVSFLVAMLSGALADVIMGSRGRWIGVVATLLAWGASVGVASLEAPRASPTRVRIGVLQTNLPQSVKGEWDLRHRYDDHQRWLETSAKLATKQPDVIVWPETMYPGFVLDPAAWKVVEDAKTKYPGLYENLNAFRADLLAVQSRITVPILTGSSGYLNFKVVEAGSDGTLDFKPERRFNSAILVRHGAAEAGRYDKMQLTPFGEVMPYISAWPWLERQFLTIGVGASGMNFDLSAGTDPFVFTIANANARPVRIVTPICFEATIPSVCRKLVFAGGARRADVIVQLTNDGWFGTFDSGRWHHALCARWRAVELATPLVRVANTGISCVVDQTGRVVQTIRGADGKAGQTEASEVVEVALGEGTTLYASIGDLFGHATLAISGLVGLIATVRRPGTSESEELAGVGPSKTEHRSHGRTKE